MLTFIRTAELWRGLGKVDMKRYLIIGIMFLLCALMIALQGCTSIGYDLKDTQVDYGPNEIINLCILQDNTISDESVEQVVIALNKEFDQYGITIEVPVITRWDRPGFNALAIQYDVIDRPLEPPCDRLMAFVGRHLGDAVWGLTLMPEIFGSVETWTDSKGFVVVQIGSIQQAIISAGNPSNPAVHEFYHMLGCPDAWTFGPCEEKIKFIKWAAHQNRIDGEDFFPAINLSGKVYWTREDVERKLRTSREKSK